MLWPVLLDSFPRETDWSVGERVEARLSWLDDPDLPADLVLHQVAVRAGTWPDADGEPWAQMIESGDLRALRQGDHRPGDLSLDGCLIVDAHPALTGDLPRTAGVVRRVRLVQALHQRGPDDWIRRPDGLRLTDLPDAGTGRFRDDPDRSGPASPGSMRILSPEQYFHLAGDRLPAEQWQARGFLVDLDVADAVEPIVRQESG